LIEIADETLGNLSAMMKSASTIPSQPNLADMWKRKEDKDKDLASGGAGDRPSAKKRRVVVSEPEDEEEHSDEGVVAATSREKEDVEDAVESDDELEERPNVASKRCAISNQVTAC
jgi:hypothetical protein